MKLYSLIFYLCFIITSSHAAEEEWVLDRASFYFEDDLYTDTDDEYSAGERFSFLWYLPKENYFIYDILMLDIEPSYSHFTFAITNQIFTPSDKNETSLILDDRPYAGWSYLEFGIHKSSKTHLRSVLLQIGAIGSASFSEDIQNTVHGYIGVDEALGWDNQLNNELGINLKYVHKWMYLSSLGNILETSFVPFAEVELGNVAINATLGSTFRFGYNITKDFGVSSIDIGADPGIPIYGEYQNMKKQSWSFSFNLIGAGTAVARDIFLDGNTFTSSHSVDKEPFIYYYGFGFTARYKNFVFDFIEINNSKRFKEENMGHGVGTLIGSWLF